MFKSVFIGSFGKLRGSGMCLRYFCTFSGCVYVKEEGGFLGKRDQGNEVVAVSICESQQSGKFEQ